MLLQMLLYLLLDRSLNRIGYNSFRSVLGVFLLVIVVRLLSRFLVRFFIGVDILICS
jgi:hypothetical protein